MDRELPRHAHDDSGFTLVEVIVAAVLLVVGLVAVAYGMAVGLAVVATAQEDTIARQKAREAMEDIFTARDTLTITFDQICNVGDGPSCIFVKGAEPLWYAGVDGIVNTADDSSDTRGTDVNYCGDPINNPKHVECVFTPGPSGVLGSAQDVRVFLTGYQREVQIKQISSILTQITVIITYTTPGGLSRKVTLAAVMSPYV
jgi:prepilin-type N-terminal cleavage/methylation domain-containing protein